jgi:hypothetical protein
MRICSLRKTSSNGPEYLLSRSRIRKRIRSRSPVKLRLRACWVTQRPSGFVVQPASQTRRLGAGAHQAYRNGGQVDREDLPRSTGERAGRSRPVSTTDMVVAKPWRLFSTTDLCARIAWSAGNVACRERGVANGRLFGALAWKARPDQGTHCRGGNQRAGGCKVREQPPPAHPQADLALLLVLQAEFAHRQRLTARPSAWMNNRHVEASSVAAVDEHRI